MASFQIRNRSSFGITRVHLRRREGKASGVVLFFPGDRLESTNETVRRLIDPVGALDVMQRKFPDSDVMLVEPARYEPPGQANAYACYDNFLERSTWSGDPIGYHTTQKKGLKQLSSILEEAENSYGMERGIPITLVGFSKGCVVLNQLLKELAETTEEKDGDGFRVPGRFRAIHFVDAGLNRPGAYPTDDTIAQFLSKSCTSVYFHGTPRQWNDSTRAWILEEKSRSQEILQKHNVAVSQRMYLKERHHDDHVAHFEVLEVFDPELKNQDDVASDQT